MMVLTAGLQRWWGDVCTMFLVGDELKCKPDFVPDGNSLKVQNLENSHMVLN